jgi:hypothetical protein
MTGNRILLLLVLFGIVGSFVLVQNLPVNKTRERVIYNQLSNDYWGTSTARDTIDEEYSVVLTKDSLTITELVPGSVFFTRMLKDSTLKTISFALENGGYKSNEYWATLVGGDERLKTYNSNVSWATVHATSSIVRIVLRMEGWAWEETYYFWPSTVNRQQR